MRVAVDVVTAAVADVVAAGIVAAALFRMDRVFQVRFHILASLIILLLRQAVALLVIVVAAITESHDSQR